MKIDNTQSLSHTSYRCKYHIVIVPKYRRMVIYNRLRRDIIEILKVLIQRKPDVRIIEGEACPDHIHMLLEMQILAEWCRVSGISGAEVLE